MSFPFSIAGASFLLDPLYRKVVEAIAIEGDSARAVGGAVRDYLLGVPVSDVDIATTALPETVMQRARDAGLTAIPTGIAHGTITVIADHHAFEVTTLRADVATDGRRAIVAFTRDYAADASRRDFTMNAIYADRDGTLYDPTGGIPDLLAGRVRFIGQAEARIREDYLRILRFFRFHASLGRGAPDPEGLAAATALRNGLHRLSRERITGELRKLLLAPRAGETLAIMDEAGILAELGTTSFMPHTYSRFVALAREAAVECAFIPALAALCVPESFDPQRLAHEMRLANDERKTLEVLQQWAEKLGPVPDRASIKQAVYRIGNRLATDALLLAAARAQSGLPEGLDLARSWRAPRFPITGSDLLAQGHKPGPELGQRLKELEAAWIAADFGEK